MYFTLFYQLNQQSPQWFNLLYVESFIPYNLKNSYHFVEVIIFDIPFQWILKDSPVMHIEKHVKLFDFESA